MPFLDIFSKPERKGKIEREQQQIEQIKPKILADIHEKDSSVILELKLLNIEVETKKLNIADYIINNIAIERKSFSDFISSMISRRLLKQLLELKQYKKHFLILEGADLASLGERKINSNAIRGMILSILLEFEIPIIFTSDPKDTAQFLAILAKKSDRQEISLHSQKFKLSKKEQLRYILESFPNIGPKTSDVLLKKHKTLRNIFNTKNEELKKEIGKKADSLNIFDEVY